MATATSNGESTNLTKEDRIQQLNEIDKNVAKLVKSAGEAIEALSGRSKDQTTKSSTEGRGAFTLAASQYFALLSSVDVNLRRQIYALEEADIISAEPASKEAHPAQNQRNKGTEAGGAGSLDIGWLNSRTDKSGKELEAEIWAKAAALVKDVEEFMPKDGAS